MERIILRVAAVLLGGASSASEASAMRPVSKPEDLDKCGDGISIDTFMPIVGYLGFVGLKPAKTMSYADACYSGIAPAPTTEEQRKIHKEIEDELAEQECMIAERKAKREAAKAAPKSK